MATEIQARNLDADNSEALINAQLKRTRSQVKGVEFGSRMLKLVVGVLLFFLFATLLDHWVVGDGLPIWARVILWLSLIGGILWYAVKALLPLLLYRVNPLYAARTIEETKPSLKNSLINYLTLRPEQDRLPSVIYDAIAKQAATGVKDATVDHAVDHAPLIRWGYLLLGLTFCFALYFVVSPKNPFRTVARVVVPWADLTAPSRVHIVEVTPGNTQLYRGKTVKVSATIEGLSEDEPATLHYTTADGQQREQPIKLKLDELRNYTTLLPVPVEKQSGIAAAPRELAGLQQDFEYYITAGDARTKTFRVQVAPAPYIGVERIEYKYPAYTKKPAETRQGEVNIEALEGTTVTIHGTANQPLKRAWIELRDNAGKPARFPEMKITDQMAVGSWNLGWKDPSTRELPDFASYAVRFRNQNGDDNPEPIAYPVKVIRDEPPTIDILAPSSAEISVPVDQPITFEVRAQDPDFGLQEVKLYGTRGDKPIFSPNIASFAAGNAHQGNLQQKYTRTPKELGLQAGDVIDYWVTATDNKAPNPNVVLTSQRKLRVIESQKNRNNNDPLAKNQPQQNNQNQPQNNNERDPNQKQQPNNQQNEQGNQNPMGNQGQPNNDQGNNGQGQQANDPTMRNQDQNNQQQNNNDPQQQPQNGNNAQPNNQNQDPTQKNQPQNPDNKNQQQQPNNVEPGKNGNQQQNNTNQQKPNDPNQGNKSGDQQPNNGQQPNNAKQPNDPQNQKNQPQNPMGGGNQNQPQNGKQGNEQQPNNGQKQPQNNQGENGKQNPQSGDQNNKQEQNGNQQSGKPDPNQQAQGRPQDNNDKVKSDGSQDSDAFQRLKEMFDKKPDPKQNEQQANNQQQNGGQQNQNNKEPGKQNEPGKQKEQGKQNEPGQQNAGKDQSGNQQGNKPENGKEPGKPEAGKQPNEKQGGNQTGESGASKDPNQQNSGNNKSGDQGKQGSAQPEAGKQPSSNDSKQPGEQKNSGQDQPNGNKQQGTKQGEQSPNGAGQKPDPMNAQQQPGSGDKTGNQQAGKSGTGEKPEPGQKAEPGKQAEPNGKQLGDLNPDGKRQGTEKKEPGANAKPSNSQDSKQGNTTEPENRQDPRNNQQQSGQGNPDGPPEAQEKGKSNPNSSNSNANQNDMGKEKSPSTKAGDSASKGDEGGDRSGGGKGGGGQQENKPGRGAAGSNTEDEKGAGKGQQEGDGETGNKAGNKQQSADKTGNSGKEAGNGTEQKQGDGKQPGGQAGKNGADDKKAKQSVAKAAKEGKQSGKQPTEQQGKQNPQPGEPQEGNTKEGPAGNMPGGGGNTTAPSTPPEYTGPHATSPEDPVNDAYAKKATDLVLEQLGKQLRSGNVDQNLLNKLGWDQKQAQEFYDRWSARKQAATQPGPAGDAAANKLRDQLRSLGLRPEQSSNAGDNTADDSQRGNRVNRRSAPPSEYRDIYRAFQKGSSGG